MDTGSKFWPVFPSANRKVYAASEAAGARYCWFFTEPSGDQLREIAGLVECGAIKPVIDSSNCPKRWPIWKKAGRAARSC